MRHVYQVLLCLLLLLLPRLVSAQTHPCDLPAPPSGTAVAGSTMALSACLPPNDINGVPITSVTGWTVYDNGVSTSLTLTKGTTSAASGLTRWAGPWIAPSQPGSHAIEVTATGSNSSGTAKESPKSAPFSLALSAAPASPTAPVKLAIQ